MLSTVAVAFILGVLVVFLIKSKLIKLPGAIVCVVFGLVVGLTPIGDPVDHVLNASGVWLWQQVSRL